MVLLVHYKPICMVYNVNLQCKIYLAMYIYISQHSASLYVLLTITYTSGSLSSFNVNTNCFNVVFAFVISLHIISTSQSFVYFVVLFVVLAVVSSMQLLVNVFFLS